MIDIHGYVLSAKCYSDVKSHSHKCYELHFITEGKGFFRIKDEMVEIKSGEAIIILPNEKHNLIVSSSGNFLVQYILQFNPIPSSEFDIFLKNEFCPKRIFSLSIPIYRFEENVWRFDSGNQIMQEASRYSFVSMMYDIYLTANIPVSSITPVDKALLIMHQSINKHLDLETLSSMLGLDKAYFSRIFKQATHDSPMKYFNRLKMESAKDMLSSTNLSVLEIANRLAFSDEMYFSRAFKKHSAISPLKYRKKLVDRDC